MTTDQSFLSKNIQEGKVLRPLLNEDEICPSCGSRNCWWKKTSQAKLAKVELVKPWRIESEERNQASKKRRNANKRRAYAKKKEKLRNSSNVIISPTGPHRLLSPSTGEEPHGWNTSKLEGSTGPQTKTESG